MATYFWLVAIQCTKYKAHNILDYVHSNYLVYCSDSRITGYKALTIWLSDKT